MHAPICLISRFLFLTLWELEYRALFRCPLRADSTNSRAEHDRRVSPAQGPSEPDALTTANPPDLDVAQFWPVWRVFLPKVLNIAKKVHFSIGANNPPHNALLSWLMNLLPA